MSLDFNLAGKRIWVAGHTGMVGSALVRRLAPEGCDLVTVDRGAVDLRRQSDVEAWLEKANPDGVFLAAARVGGIYANDTHPAEFLYDNLAIEANVIEASRRAGVKKLMLLGSSCIYPKLATQPMDEDQLLTGPLEPTNEWYAVAKIAGVKMCQAYRLQYGCNFISVMPTNLYGQGDNFDLTQSHVIPGLMRRMHEAKLAGAAEVAVWGTGAAKREFLHVDDMADACVHLFQHYGQPAHVNIGTGEDISIAALSAMVKEVVGYQGELVFDPGKPDGTPRKLLDVNRLHELGWRHKIGLRQGLAATYRWFEMNMASARLGSGARC